MPGPASRRARVRERPRLRALAALLASAALNAAVLWWLAAAGAFSEPRRVERTSVALAPVDPRAWAENRSVRPEPPRPREAPPPPAPRGRVVELPPNERAQDRAPDSSRFLSDRNARVERETVSRDAGRYPRPAPRAETGAAARPPRAAGRAASPDVAPRPPPRTPPHAVDERVARAEGLDVPRVPGGEDPSASRRGGSPPTPGPHAGPAPRPDLTPSPGALARIAGGPSMDGYREAEEGDETSLSSREFRFATFLNQMRRAIGDVWYPSVEAAIRERDPEGRDVFYRERTVVLELTLGPSGELRRLAVAESSQVPFIDEVALAAVRKAQPFSNPPRAMFGPQGEARIPFAFTIFPFDRRGMVRWTRPLAQ